jgi:hypothetical protein
MLEENRDNSKTNIQGTSHTKQRRCVTTYGKLALVMSNGMVKQNHAVCAAIMKIGGMSSHANRLTPN